MPDRVPCIADVFDRLNAALREAREAAARLEAAASAAAEALRAARSEDNGNQATARPGEVRALPRYLTADEAASIARVDRRTIYGWSRSADWQLFSRRPSRKVLLIEECGFRRWLDGQKGRRAPAMVSCH
jgi:hypothetical protein